MSASDEISKDEIALTAIAARVLDSSAALTHARLKKEIAKAVHFPIYELCNAENRHSAARIEHTKNEDEFKAACERVSASKPAQSQVGCACNWEDTDTVVPEEGVARIIHSTYDTGTSSKANDGDNTGATGNDSTVGSDDRSSASS